MRTKSRWVCSFEGINLRGQNDYMQCSFCFRLDTFNHTRTLSEQTEIIESFSYMDFQGPIRLRDAQEVFTVHELWGLKEPKKLLRVYLGRYVPHFAGNFIDDVCLVRKRLSRFNEHI